MATQVELSAQPVLARWPGSTDRSVSDRQMARALRGRVGDAASDGRASHVPPPLAMAEAATLLWTRFLKFDAADPHWPDRDRFVLAAGQGALLHALLHLTGHAGLDAALPAAASGGFPNGHWTGMAVEAGSGPLGQGLAAAIGLALAERLLAGRFGKSLVDHRTWVMAAAGDLTEGASHEAASLAGHLRLEKLTVLVDAGPGEAGPLACSEDVAKRYAAYGWAVKSVDGNDPAQIAAALSFAIRSKKPTLIACLCAADPPAARAAGDWGPEAAAWRAAGARAAPARRSWLKRLTRHPARPEFERVMAGRLPDGWQAAVGSLKAEFCGLPPEADGDDAAQTALEVLLPAMPELVGGAAGPAGFGFGALLGRLRGMPAVTPGGQGGRAVQFGPRQHGMAAAVNGMALHGGVLPFAAGPLGGSDAMRPALRLAARTGQRVIHLLTEDGQDGLTQADQLAGLRAVPNVCVFRPGAALEAAECWELALRRTEGPSVLVLASAALPALRGDAGENRSLRGGYVLAEAEGPRQATLIATGSELAVAVAAREALAAEGIAVAIVSLPCWELFALQDPDYRSQVLGGVARIGIEAGCGFGWERWLGPEGSFVGPRAGHGAPSHPAAYSALDQDDRRQAGVTPESVTNSVRRRVGREQRAGES